MSIAFIFPGQGSQAVGMGAELAKAYAPARAVFAEVDEALGQPLAKLMWEGPEDQLTLTENAQPALMAVSLAAIAHAGSREGVLAQRPRQLRRRAFARRIFGARRGGSVEPRRYRAPAQDAWARHAGGGARRPGRNGGAARRRFAASAGARQGRERRRGLCRRQRQCARAGGDLRAPAPRSSGRWRLRRNTAPAALCCFR